MSKQMYVQDKRIQKQSFDGVHHSIAVAQHEQHGWGVHDLSTEMGIQNKRAIKQRLAAVQGGEDA